MKRYLVLISILIISFLLRVLWIGEIPAGFTPDEASFGYDAYSIMKTGKDQWGKPFPLVLESFGDFKSPLYSYLDIPFIALFGLNKFSVRLPNAILGTVVIYITYLLVKEMLKKNLALTASLLLAVSPWHIMLTRGAFEANLTTFFIPLGLLLFLKGLKYPKFLFYSSVVFGFNMFTYHSAKFLTPLFLIFVIFIFRKPFFKVVRPKLAISGIVFGIFLCITFFTFFAGAGKRISERSVFVGMSDVAAPKRLALIQKGVPEGVAKLVYNKYSEGAKLFAKNYFTYLSPKFLFTQGAGETTYGMFPGQGVLYWFELPLLVTFIYLIFKEGKRPRYLLFVFWFLLGIIPAAMSTGVGYAANRAAFVMPSLEIISAIGFVKLWTVFQRKKYYLVGYVAYSFLMILFFLNNYFLGSKEIMAKGMLYGNLEAAQWLSQNVSEFDKVIVSKSLSEPQIYVAFAQKWNPNNYQGYSENWNYSSYGVSWVDQIPVYTLGNFTFKNIEPDKDLNEAHYLVARRDELPANIPIIESFNYPGGEVALVIVGGKASYYAKN